MGKMVIIMLSFLAIARAGTIRTDYLPTAVSYATTSSPTLATAATVDKTVPVSYTKTYTPTPAYESVSSIQEGHFTTLDGTGHTTFSKSLNTAFADTKKFDPKIDGGLITHTIPAIYSENIHSHPIIYHPATNYDLSTPFVHSHSNSDLTKAVALPVTYTAHSGPLTKTLPSFTYRGPIIGNNEVVSTRLHGYSSHGPLIVSEPGKTTITYSDAPLVSHMSFSGLGANYAW